MAYAWMLCPALTKGDLAVLQATCQGPWKAQLVSLAMYGEPDDPRYAAILQEPYDRPWRVEVDITSPQDFIARSVSQASDGFFATLITGTGADSSWSPYYYRLTAVFEYGAPTGPPALLGPDVWQATPDGPASQMPSCTITSSSAQMRSACVGRTRRCGTWRFTARSRRVQSRGTCIVIST
jgi:hypothetical protein